MTADPHIYERRGTATRRSRTSPTPGDRKRRTIAVVLLAYFAVATFPGLLRVSGPGLDPSWVYALNSLVSAPLRFGSDLVFTYGPLGFLLVPLSPNLLASGLLWVGLQTANVVVVIHHYRRTRSLLQLGSFVVLTILAGSFGPPLEYRLLFTIVLLLTIDPTSRPAWLVAAPAAATCAAMAIYMKTTSGVAAGAMVVLAMLAWIRRDDTSTRDVLVWCLAPFVVVFGVIGLVTTGGLGGLLLWMSRSWALVSGFAEAMSVPGPPILVLLGAIAGGAFLIVAAVLLRRRAAELAWMLPLTILLFAAYRHAYVRHYGRFVFPVLLLAFGVLVIASSSRRIGVILVAAGTVLATAGFAAAMPGCICPWHPRALTPINGATTIAALARLPDTTRDLEARTARSLRRDRLPTKARAVVGASHTGVDTVPAEISFIPANDLPWNPNPVLQTYHAYTSGLDHWVARHFLDPDGPDFVLVEFTDIDGRHPMFGAPAMWRALLTRYELALPHPVAGSYGQVLLLERRAVPVDLGARLSGSAQARLGQWVPVPADGELPFAQIHVRYGLLGRIAQLVWRTDPLYVDLDYGGGRVATFRVVPGTLEDGLLIGPTPLNVRELSGLFEGRLPARVRRFRLYGPGMSSFEPAFTVIWQAASWIP